LNKVDPCKVELPPSPTDDDDNSDNSDNSENNSKEIELKNIDSAELNCTVGNSLSYIF
jgi:hypothetical protein